MSKQRFVLDYFLAILGGILSAINIKSFLNAAGLVAAGFSGISLLSIRIGAKYFDMNLSYGLIYLILNIPTLLFVIKYVGKHFTAVSVVFIIFSSVLVDYIPAFSITNDILLIAVFGGIINGISNSLVIAGNGCGGGMDFISIYFSKMKHMSVWNYSFAINVGIICISGILFGWDAALYSIIYQYVSTTVIKLFDDRYKRISFFIISEKADEICEAVYSELHHSVTILNGVGSFTQEIKNVIYIVVGEYEQKRLTNILMRIDPKAFVNIVPSKKLVGNFREKEYY